MRTCMMLGWILCTLPLIAISTEERKIQAYLHIGDSGRSIEEAKQWVHAQPDQPASYQALLYALGQAGRIDSMYVEWKAFALRFPKEAYDPSLLEHLCWDVLKKGRDSSVLTSRILATIGAALSQDAFAVNFLLEALRDSNVTLRQVGIELASLLGDAPLKMEILSLLKTEKQPTIRIKLMEAIGRLKIEDARDDLLRMVEQKQIAAEERKAARVALLALSEGEEMVQIERLAHDARAALRQLAAEWLGAHASPNGVALLAELVCDSHIDVIAAALRSIGQLRVKEVGGVPVCDIASPLASHPDPLVGITASWLLLLHDRRTGEQAFTPWISHGKEEVRAMAAAAIAATGPYGLRLALQLFEQTTDSYLLMNLAPLLIRQRVNAQDACRIFDHVLRHCPEQLMIEQRGFNPIVRSRLTHQSEVVNYPEVMNQTIRLQMCNLLAILEYPQAVDVLRSFLKKTSYDLTGIAAEMYLEEGDELAFDQVRALLQDPDETVQLEAALVLATWAKEATAFPYLIDRYHSADRHTKIRILEALGRAGNTDLAPFLMSRFEESSLNLRIIAAAVLLQCLNR